ncbi:MAG: adenylate/guanylate cyclase domain-containing protein, partial [Pseudomonadota bacterium]
AEGIAGHVFTTGETVTVADAYADGRLNPEIDGSTGYRTRSILCVPIVHRDGRAIGVIQALNRREGGFTPACAERLRAFAAQAAVALVNAQLFADLDGMRRYSESILRSLSNGVISLDAQGRLVKANAAARVLAGIPDDGAGKPLTALVDPRSASWLTLLDGDAEKSYLADVALQAADGQQHDVNISRVPLTDLNDDPIGALLVLEDITAEKRVRSTLSRYLPGQVAERVLTDPENNLGGVAQTATVLFSDIRSFTSISETIGARATVSMLNEYFSAMAEAVLVNNGIVDKYIGDAIMAVFGVPFTTESDADNAVLASISMLGRLDALNRRREARGEAPISIGIGLSTGEVVAGNVGSSRRMDYTVIGDTVNLAARLESATKAYGASLVAAEGTVAALSGEYPLRKIDRIRVRGKGEPVKLYQLFSPASAPTGEALEIFAAGRALFIEQQWHDAERRFEDVLRLDPDDGAAALHIERCRRFRQVAPPPDWDGVAIL